MASVQKFTKKAVGHQIQHVERTAHNISNPDFDSTKISRDYSLINRDINSFDYYKERLSQCYLYNRPDVNTLFGWIVTLPDDVKEENEDLFFYNVHDFLCERYGGEKNCVTAVVHKDESGKPHMHWLGIPIVEDKKHVQGEKVCCNDVINKRDLRNFHEDLDKFLKGRGMNCGVYTGVTKRQGGNMTVKQMKQEREMKQEVKKEVKRERKWEHVI